MLALVALHPVLLHVLVPRFGETANMVVFLAPVVASICFGWRIGFIFVAVNVVSSALMFRFYFGMGSSEGRPRAIVSTLLIAGLCFGADKLFQFIAMRKRMAEELRRAKKMEAIGRLAGGVAHDMNNTLNAIMGSVFAHRQELSVYGRQFSDLDNIAAACDRGAQLTQNLLGFARKSNFKHTVFSLNRIMQQTELLLRRTASKNILIKAVLAQPEPFMEGDRGQMENAVMNLCLNAMDAMGTHGTLTLSTGIRKNEVFLSVSDTGEGMDHSVQEHVFEPFFTTKEEGKGTGLGLSMVYGAVHAMKGKIRLESSPGQGTDVFLTFPAQSAVEAEASLSSFPPAPTDDMDALDGQSVLLVDDEPLVLRAGARLLKSLGCDVVFSAKSGADGISLFEEHKERISLVVLDLVMPELDGIATLEALHKIDDELPVIIVSGYTEDSEKLSVLQMKTKTVCFLAKPYRADQLLKVAKKLLSNRRLSSRVSSA